MAEYCEICGEELSPEEEEEGICASCKASRKNEFKEDDEDIIEIK